MPEILKRPHWLNKKIDLAKIQDTRALLHGLNLNTVCVSAMCPNIGECFSKSVATFMILGENCTRNCGFCGVRSGVPSPVDVNEPYRIVAAIRKLRLRHVVITSVTRDDLEDGGSGHFACCVRGIRENISGVKIEILIPDFRGDTKCLDAVLENGPDIIGHNLETVPRIYPNVRKGADYRRSVNVLRYLKLERGGVYTKSGIMLGLGETEDEVVSVFRDLRRAGCDFLSIGQYLRPTRHHTPVMEYIEPERFDEYKRIAISLGFSYVSSGPYVRSSYQAENYLYGD